MAVDLSLINASNGSGEAVRALVTGSRLVGSTVIPVDAQTNYPTKFIGTTGTLDTNGRLTVATMQVFKGHRDGANLVIDSFAPGYTDKGNSAGDIVVIKPTTLWSDIIAEALQTTFNDDGTLKTGIVSSAKIADNAITPEKIANGSVGYDELNFNGLGVVAEASIGSWSQGAILTPVSFNGLSSISFNAVAGRKYRAEVFLAQMGSAANTTVFIQGAVTGLGYVCTGGMNIGSTTAFQDPSLIAKGRTWTSPTTGTVTVVITFNVNASGTAFTASGSGGYGRVECVG